jgi:lipoprotein-releasing system permease protein
VEKSTKTAFFIALRYFFSRKKNNIINIISIISVLGIMASTAALIIVLSVFNGLQDLVVSNFNRFNPPLKIEAKEGKVFSISDFRFPISEIENMEGVKAVEQVLSDLVLVIYNDKQMLTTLYGISENFPELSGLDAMTIDGYFSALSPSGIVFGTGIAGLLNIELNNYEPAKLYYPKRNKKNLANPLDAFQTSYASPVGVFVSNTPYDANAAFVSMKLAKEIFNYETEISFIAVYFNAQISIQKVQKKISQMLGDDFTVKNQMQQEALLFKTIKGENLVVFLILGFILFIATFNIIGILGMLIVEKKQDISILHTLGASKALLKRVFLLLGVMIGTLGGFLGICFGYICCFLQHYFGIISFGKDESVYILSAYPVLMDLKDAVIVFFLIIVISLLTSGLALRGLKNNYLINKY